MKELIFIKIRDIVLEVSNIYDLEEDDIQIISYEPANNNSFIHATVSIDGTVYELCALENGQYSFESI